ncbi:transcriptional regulator, MarR family (plasmid) [Paracoccus aminophilus JCM 7686]|uniref:Transcriptional regulator, MarR family n=1 Tax=Paracoccus aminophilus JCM 7686 TaxID=1367847 RepID=S5Y4Z2_PARAH|nr:transcriptional regulator, MarR family [Paracoccus aminophilus JCM 7686]
MPADHIARIRRFHRAVTTEVGLLDASFLGRGRPLGPARVLNAIGQGIREISEIRAYLRLDSGLMSRLLRGLETEGLIVLDADPGDSRKRRARLTDSGAAEVAIYEALSDQQATTILAAHPRPDALLAAMDLVASALGRTRIALDEVPPDAPEAQLALHAYYTELGHRLKQGFDVNLSCDPEAGAMTAPRGAFLVARSDGMVIGCAGLKGTDKGYAEIKRVWVAPSARGLGLARQMMAGLEARAAALGISCLRLDTNSALPEAVALYRALGWAEIPRFNDDPYPDLFFEKNLGAAGA